MTFYFSTEIQIIMNKFALLAFLRARQTGIHFHLPNLASIPPHNVKNYYLQFLLIFNVNDNSIPSPKLNLRDNFSDYNFSMVNLVFYIVTISSETWFRPSSCTSFPVLSYLIIKTCNKTLVINGKLL